MGWSGCFLASALTCCVPQPAPSTARAPVKQFESTGEATPSDSSKPLREPDVPYEPSSAQSIAAMLELGQAGPRDVIYDLGCGDGRVVIEAVRQSGAKGVCVDIDPERIREARENAERAGVSARMTFRTEDLFETNIRDANVVMLFLWPEINLRLLPKLMRELAPGSRIVSNMHDMGDLPPERVITVKSPKTGKERGVFLWRVPPSQTEVRK